MTGKRYYFTEGDTDRVIWQMPKEEQELLDDHFFEIQGLTVKKLKAAGKFYPVEIVWSDPMKKAICEETVREFSAGKIPNTMRCKLTGKRYYHTRSEADLAISQMPNAKELDDKHFFEIMDFIFKKLKAATKFQPIETVFTDPIKRGIIEEAVREFSAKLDAVVKA